MANHRIERINEEFRKELSSIISNEIRDPRLKAMVSVTAVSMTPDLKTCKVYLSIYGKNKEEEKDTFEALKKARGFMRTRLSKLVNLRNTPELTLIEDNTIDYGMHIDELLRKVSKEDEKLNAASKEAGKEKEDE